MPALTEKADCLYMCIGYQGRVDLNVRTSRGTHTIYMNLVCHDAGWGVCGNSHRLDALAKTMPTSLTVATSSGGVYPRGYSYNGGSVAELMEWVEIAKSIRKAGVYDNLLRNRYGENYRDLGILIEYTRCYSDLQPIASKVVAETYINEKNKLYLLSNQLRYEGDVITPHNFVDTSQRVLARLLNGGCYINAYSFYKEPITDPIIALALAYNRMLIPTQAEGPADVIDKKYGLRYR